MNLFRLKIYFLSEKDEKFGEKMYWKFFELFVLKGFINWNLLSIRFKERKFIGRCWFFVGNLVSCDEVELKGMFEKYGEVVEIFVNNDKGFGFVRLVSR